MQEIANHLYFKRFEMGLTIYQLSDALGFSYNSIKAWESGKTSPQADKLEKWLEFFGYNLSDCLNSPDK